nr:transmembrane protein 150C-like isoform X2 [Paramormyrops kingsleyae]
MPSPANRTAVDMILSLNASCKRLTSKLCGLVSGLRPAPTDRHGAASVGKDLGFPLLEDVLNSALKMEQQSDMWACNPWMFLPILFWVFTTVGLWVVYFIAVEDGKIASLSSEFNASGSLRPPYISIAGNSPPASCYFSQIMNMAAFAAFVIGVLRYLQLKPRLQKPWMNIICLVAQSLACFGMMLVGNFQLSSNAWVHNVGTLTTFCLGIMYCWLQSVLTLTVNFRNEGWRVGIARFLLSGAISFCMLLYTVLKIQRLHIHAARAQWVLVMFFLGFISSFAIEFRHYHSGSSVALTGAAAEREADLL